MKADLIFYNGNVLTVDKENTVAQGVAVKDGRIIAVGSDEAVLKFQDENSKQFDLQGKSIIPGLIDSHLHLGTLGMNCSAIDCRYPQVDSIEKIKDLIREAAKTTPPGQWIRGWGYDHSKLIEKRHPTREELDEVAPDNPVMIVRTCVHISANNSKSLELAGIYDDSPEIPGGIMERDENGLLNGVMKENAHMAMQKAALPTEIEMKKAFKLADQLLLSQGITSVHDSGGFGQFQLDLEKEAAESGELKVKVNAMVFSFIENLDLVEKYISSGYEENGNKHFRIGPIKLMIDGSSSGPTAATLDPYKSNPKDCGILSMDQSTIDDIVLRAHKAGFQMTCHAVGDRAVTAILDAFERTLRLYPKEDHRHRIEHCAMVNEELLQRIKKLKIIPVPQPIFLYEFGDGYLVNYGIERVEKMFTCKEYLDSGIIAPGSSDCPVTFSDPFLGMHLAVNRVTQSGQKISQSQCISKMDALRMYTINGAYTSFEENEKGSIEVGKAADLIILSRNFAECPNEEIKDIKVDTTIIDGKFEYIKEKN